MHGSRWARSGVVLVAAAVFSMTLAQPGMAASANGSEARAVWVNLAGVTAGWFAESAYEPGGTATFVNADAAPVLDTDTVSAQTSGDGTNASATAQVEGLVLDLTPALT